MSKNIYIIPVDSRLFPSLEGLAGAAEIRLSIEKAENGALAAGRGEG